MEAKIELGSLNDDQQQRMCELCETHIIEGSSSCSTFLCEGSFCDQAFEYLIEDIDDNENCKMTYKMQLKNK